MNQIINQLNDLGNINPVDFSELEAALQAIDKITKATTVSAERAGTALKMVIDRINSEKDYVTGAQSRAEGNYSTVSGSRSIAYGDFKTVYGEIR